MNKETFATLALYNREVNQVLRSVVADNESLCTEAGTTYFGSVLDLLMHVASGDIGWIRHLWYGDDAAPRALSKRIGAIVERTETQPDEWVAIRAEADAVIDRYCDGLSAGVLLQDVALRSPHGDSYSLPRWQCMLHMFNHQTHHRGQLAQVLDDRGIENDFSNLFRYLL